MNKNKFRQTPLLLAFGLFCAPIFFINLFLPAYPQSSFDFIIDDFLDNQLLGRIGFWSSFFPFSSKATANYVAIFGPCLALFSTYQAFTIEFDPAQFDEMTLKRYLVILVGGVFLFVVYAWNFYVNSSDLATAKGKYGRIFGINIISFSVYYSANSICLYFLVPFMLHRCFFYIPCRLIKKWWCTKQKSRNHRSKIFIGLAKSAFWRIRRARLTRNPPMQMTTALLIVNPCDDEEDNMAMLCCHSDKGEMFLMSRYPDEDELEITLDGEPSTLDGVKVTLSASLLKIEIAAADADALNGDDVLEISFNPDMVDRDEVVETLKNILDGTGTFISEV